MSQLHNNINQYKAWAQFIKLPIVRKTFGTVEGQHPSIFKGIGQDFEEFRLYQPGDNVKYIDWRASAKGNAPVIKQYKIDANTSMAFVVDSGREMITRATSGERKIDVARNVCNMFGYLSSQRFDAVGLLAGDNDRMIVERAKLGFTQVNLMLSNVERISTVDSPIRSYAKVLNYANTHFNRRHFLVLIFDEANVFYVQQHFIPMVRKLKERHDVFAVSIRTLNPFKQELPNVKGHILDVNDHSYLPAFFRNDKVSSIAKKNILLNRKRLAKVLCGF
ncbi:hypothetical protein FACS1894125_3830 [Actinomycetota bacterium]|nr:hypothetical protein FACS1894125_3830 [Actinomycetota bacterium]